MQETKSTFSSSSKKIQVSSADLVVQVVTIAESIRLQSVLATYGIMTQTPNEIEPVQIWSQWQMVKVYEHLGRNQSLGLSGRPPRPMGSLGSSKVRRIFAFGPQIAQRITFSNNSNKHSIP